MHVIGVFQEIEPDGVNLRSIVPYAGQLSREDQRLVLRYLQGDSMVMAWMGVTRDPLVGERVVGVSGGPSICSDTLWIWRYDLAHFVQHHRLGLPAAFLAHVRQQDGVYTTTRTALSAAFQQIMTTYDEALSTGESLRY